MLNRKTIALGGGVALLAGAVIVRACGPFFPLQLLDNRAGTLSGTPNNSFAYEASHLVTPADHLQAPEAASVPAGQQPVDPAQAVLAGLSPEQIATLAAMAKAADGDAAYAMGAGVPEAQRLYAAADVDFGHALAVCTSTASAASDAPASEANATAANAAASSSPPAIDAASTADTLRSACAPREPLLSRAATRLDAILALPGSTGAPRAVAAATELAAIAQARADNCTGDACAALTAALPAAYAISQLTTTRNYSMLAEP